MRRRSREGFTIVELLVVVSIIGLLFALLLPAIGKVRDSARVSVSKNNLIQAAIAHKTYAADWADRHVTYTRDGLGLYGGKVTTYDEMVYGDGGGGFDGHPPIIAGWGYNEGGSYVAYGYWTDNARNNVMFQAMNFPGGPLLEEHEYPGVWDYHTATLGGWGWFRFGIQPKPMNDYFNGRYQDRIFYAPKDRILAPIEFCFDLPGEFIAVPPECNPAWSSYCLSPAGLFSPQVFSDDGNGVYWTPPWELPAGYKVPSFGQVKYPTLKTHMLEHQWLQNNTVPCNDSFTGCEQYFFNHSFQSAPVTLFYDGSVRLMSVLEAMSSDRRHDRQAGHGLWSRDTSFGVNGYFIDDGYDFAATSYHILTTEGVRGRDTIGRE